jgi:hypothetical protein
VVVDDVQNHFDAGLMHRFDQRAELVHRRRASARGVGLVRRHEVERHVSPVVSFLGVELMNGQELDGGDPERLQVRDLVDQPSEGASAIGRNARSRPPRESADVQLVDDEIMCVPRSRIVSPVERGRSARQHAERGPTRVRTWRSRRGAAEAGRKVNGGGIRVEQHFRRIEPVPFVRLIGSVDAIGVILRAGHLGGGHPAVPDASRLTPERIEAALGEWLRRVGAVQQQGDAGRVPRVQREIPRLTIVEPGRAQRVRRALDIGPPFHARQS